jgi:leucine-rich repeat protein SHOC2
MILAALEELIETARRDRLFQSNPSATSRERTDLPWLDLSNRKITSIPESIGSLTYLTRLNLQCNALTKLPESLGQLVNLIELNLSGNQLTTLPECLGNLNKLIELNLHGNPLKSLPDSLVNLPHLTILKLGGSNLQTLPIDIPNLSQLTKLDLSHSQLKNLPDNIDNLQNLTELKLHSNRLNTLPENIGNLTNLNKLDLCFNHLTSLPTSLHNLSNLVEISLAGNPLADLSVLQNLPKLKRVKFSASLLPTRFWVDLPHRYWTKLSDWQPKWLLDELNAEIRQTLIDRVGYEKICSELNAVILDSWQEYTLLKVDIFHPKYNKSIDGANTESMVLLKMTCPSTARIHILRVPPEMESAEAAILWVNHGIHPDRFAIQT